VRTSTTSPSSTECMLCEEESEVAPAIVPSDPHTNSYSESLRAEYVLFYVQTNGE
jgi:hypothetical protein